MTPLFSPPTIRSTSAADTNVVHPNYVVNNHHDNEDDAIRYRSNRTGISNQIGLGGDPRTGINLAFDNDMADTGMVWHGNREHSDNGGDGRYGGGDGEGRGGEGRGSGGDSGSASVVRGRGVVDGGVVDGASHVAFAEDGRSRVVRETLVEAGLVSRNKEGERKKDGRMTAKTYGSFIKPTDGR